MTVAELRAALTNLPDDMQVVLTGNRSTFYSWVEARVMHYVGDDADVSRGEADENLRHEPEAGFNELVLVLDGGW